MDACSSIRVHGARISIERFTNVTSYLAPWRRELDHAVAVPPEQIVLLHCSTGSAEQWKPLTQETIGFRCIPIDLRGDGNVNRWQDQHARAGSEFCLSL